MEKRYIKITEYCRNQKIEISFLIDLKREGILKIQKHEEIEYLHENDLPEIEMFARWHYDLGINLEGIDAMRHMLQKIKELQQKVHELENHLR